MSKLEKNVCDNCKKETLDVYAEKGWIRFDKGNITVTNGRDKGTQGNAVSSLYLSIPEHNPLELCSVECLLKKLKLELPTGYPYGFGKAKKGKR